MAGATDAVPVIDVARFLDERPLGAFHIRIFAASILITLLDGFDLLAVSLAAPLLIEHWQVAPAAFGAVFSAGPAGMAIGALLLGSLADHVGRSRLIVFATLLFGATSFLTVFATSISALTLLRFLTGLGLGGVLPNLIALTTEYAPARQRSSLTTMAFCGLSFGSMLAGIVAAWLMPTYGWQVMFAIGGLAPVAVGMALPFLLPESVRYLAARGGRDAQIAAILRRVMPGEPIPSDARFIAPDTGIARPSPVQLFGPGRTPITLVMTLTVICNSFTLYFMLNWLPVLLRQAGLTTDAVLLYSALMNGAGGIGAILIGRFMDRFGSRHVMIVTCVLGGIGVALVGMVAQSALLVPVMLLTGGTILCALIGLYIVIAEVYPTTIRATGAGFTLGLGRIGSVLGPMAGGWALAAHWPTSAIFLMGAVPVLIASGLLVLAGYLPRRF